MANRCFLLLLILLGSWTSGCSSALYHPTHHIHYSPQSFGLEPNDLWIDGLHAWHFPANQKKSRALVVLFHGNGENLTSHFSNLSWLPAQGFEYLIFDYRGYGKTPGKPSPQNTVEDGKKIITWALSRKQPLILMGQSLGGAVLLRSLQEIRAESTTERITPVRLVVLDSTFASYQDAGQSLLSRFWITWPFQWLGQLLLSDDRAPSADQLSESSPFPYVVLHGTHDISIDPSLGRELYDSLPKPKRWIFAAGGRHIQSLWLEYPKKTYPFRQALLSIFNEVTGGPPIAALPVSNSLPFEIGRSFEVLQGPGGSFSHQGEQWNAIDFKMPEGTPVRAMRAGVVLLVEDQHTQGGPSDKFLMDANRILIEHDDGTFGEYAHLAPTSSLVTRGMRVRTGDQLAKSGSTGFSTEPHLHVMIYVTQGSIPIVFDTAEAPGVVLKKGDHPEAVLPGIYDHF